MSDITQCLNKDCILKEMCFRFTAKANEFWQSYSNFTPKEENGVTTCEYFWDNQENKRKNTKRTKVKVS